MNNLRQLLVFGLLNLLAFLTCAQSVLWEITGRKLKEPSYLYGTIHIQDKRVFAFGDEVINAFESCEAFAMEVLIDELNMEELQSAMFMKDNSLDKLLTPEEYNLLDSIVYAKTGQGMFIFKKMNPFFFSSFLLQYDLNQDMKEPLDLYLLNKAREKGKITLGIEKMSDQLNAINAISLEEQAKMLIQGLTDKDYDIPALIEDLIETYLAGDLEKIYELTKDTNMPADFNQAFLIQRNIKMAKNIHKFIRKQSTFNAIGAAHLPGEVGVIELLRKKGYTLEPVIFEWKDIE